MLVVLYSNTYYIKFILVTRYYGNSLHLDKTSNTNTTSFYVWFATVFVIMTLTPSAPYSKSFYLFRLFELHCHLHPCYRLYLINWVKKYKLNIEILFLFLIFLIYNNHSNNYIFQFEKFRRFEKWQKRFANGVDL